MKRALLMVAVWLGWMIWQRSHSRSPKPSDAGFGEALAPLSPYADP